MAEVMAPDAATLLLARGVRADSLATPDASRRGSLSEAPSRRDSLDAIVTGGGGGSDSTSVRTSASTRLVARNLAARRATVPLTAALPGLRALSSSPVGARVDLLGVVCHVLPWVDLSPRLRDQEGRQWRARGGAYLFTLCDAQGYCVPVSFELSAAVAAAARGEVQQQGLEAQLLGAAETFCQLLEAREADAEAPRRAALLRTMLALPRAAGASPKAAAAPALSGVAPGGGSSSNIGGGAWRAVLIARTLREEVQDRPDLIELLLPLLPAGWGSEWEATTLALVRRLGELWRDANAAPVLALRGARVSEGEGGGRALVLDERTLAVLEPDCGGRCELALICFQARRQEALAEGQFCVLRHEPARLSLRLRALGALAALAAAAVSTACFLLPLLCGRALFARALGGLLAENDVYCWGGGCCALWAGLSLARWFASEVLSRHNGDPVKAARLLLEWLQLGAKWAVLGVVLGILAPLLAGTLFELVFLDPFRVPHDRTPLLLVFQDWALGLAVLKGWSRLVLLGAFGDTHWQRTLERAQMQSGHVDLSWTLKEVALPILRVLALRLAAPYFFVRLYASARGVKPMQEEAMLRESFPAFTLLLEITRGLGSVQAWINAMHDIVFDHRYRVGLQLQNQ